MNGETNKCSHKSYSMALSDSEAYREGGFKDFGAFSGEPHKTKLNSASVMYLLTCTHEQPRV